MQGNSVMSTKNIVKHNQQELASPVPADLIATVDIDGAENAVRLGRISCYQGTAQEQSKYGEGVFKRGDFIDVMEARKLATNRIVLVGGEMVYQKWSKDSPEPEYTYKANQKHLIPAGDLVWDGDTPPVARKQYNAIILVEGEPWPYAWIIKGTALKAFESVLMALDTRRAAAGSIKGLYELGTEDDKNKAGNSYKRLTIKPVGDLPESMYELFRSAKTGLAKFKASAETIQDDELPI